MKIGDIIYVVHTDSAFEVEMKSDFVRSTKPMWRKDFVCSAKYLKRFSLEDGWSPYVSYPSTNPEKSTRDTFSIRKSSCYATKAEALEVVKKNWKETIFKAEYSCDYAADNVERAQKTLEECQARLRNLQQLNIDALFGEGEKYISIFSGQEK